MNNITDLECFNWGEDMNKNWKHSINSLQLGLSFFFFFSSHSIFFFTQFSIQPFFFSLLCKSTCSIQDLTFIWPSNNLQRRIIVSMYRGCSTSPCTTRCKCQRKTAQLWLTPYQKELYNTN